MVLERANITAYRLVLALAYPLVRLRLRLRARRESAYGERVAERFGRDLENLPAGAIWFHTVSAGETIAAVPLIERIIARYPDRPVLVTTMTPTGSGEVCRRLGARVAHCYAPYDFTRSVRRFFDAAAPSALILMETELWPNILAHARQRGLPVALVNARLSERSAAGYARVARLTRDMLAAVDLVACQTAAHAKRFQALGAARVEVVGNVKFDVALSQEQRQGAASVRTRWQLDARPVLIAASTHPGEEQIVLDAFARCREQLPDLCLVLVPRHPVRAAEVLGLAEQAGCSAALQSGLHGPAPDVVVGDEMGTLLMLYGLADMAFVGGSLVDRGGHNPIEPALWERPVLMGPNVYNFVEAHQLLTAAQALVEVADASSLADQVLAWWQDAAARAAAGRRGAQVVAESRGALDRQEALLLEVLGTA